MISKMRGERMRQALISTNERRAGWVALVALMLAVGFPVSLSAADAQEGQKLFQAKCVQCHGEDGSGHTVTGKTLGAFDLRSDAVQKKTDAEFYQQISHGKGNMPAFGKALSDAQINDLIAYVREFAKKQKPKKKSH
jgi:cytochrome c6